MSYVQRTKADLDLLIKQWIGQRDQLQAEIREREVKLNKLVPLIMQAVKDRRDA